MSTPTEPMDAARALDDPPAPDWAVRTAAWIRDEISVPVPELGRPGALCPYVPTALRRGHIELSACTLAGEDPQALDAALLGHAADFRTRVHELKPAEALLRCRVVVFTALEGRGDLLTGVRTRAKPLLLAVGLTVGEFFPASPDTSIRNSEVPVARSPWPSLALRHSTPHDELFLAGQPELHRIFRAAGPGIDTRTAT
ncbi:DUF6875 domain-containing protein [Kitasatospora sp. NPDC048540]|uniref:DUF6875 domain-containing protein n=1 Tax=Kitasatospora sp. NPDC048540 TaxID=3155634 RepID=UPI0033D69285